MIGCYDFGGCRILKGGGHNVYRTPSLHPDRILPFHDFIYLVKGEWEIRQENETFLMKPGDVLILHAGKHHFGEKPCREGTQTMFLHICRLPGDYVSDSGASAMPDNSLPSLIRCGNNSRVRTLFSDIIFWQHTDRFHKEIFLGSLITQLFCELSVVSRAEAYTDPIVSRAIRIIWDDPSRFLTASELSVRLGVSERTLRGKFADVLGVSPHRYQMNEKLEMIRHLLTDYPDRTLKEFAEDYGFYDEFHLSKSFKTAFGLPPSLYREGKQPPEKT